MTMVKELPIDWAENLTISRDRAVANEQDVLIIMTPWPEFQEHTFEVEARRHSTLHVIDPTGCLNEEMTQKSLNLPCGNPSMTQNMTYTDLAGKTALVAGGTHGWGGL